MREESRRAKGAASTWRIYAGVPVVASVGRALRRGSTGTRLATGAVRMVVNHAPGMIEFEVTFITARAAPIMLRVGNTPNDPALLTALLDRFARWHAVRATL